MSSEGCANEYSIINDASRCVNPNLISTWSLIYNAYRSNVEVNTPLDTPLYVTSLHNLMCHLNNYKTVRKVNITLLVADPLQIKIFVETSTKAKLTMSEKVHGKLLVPTELAVSGTQYVCDNHSVLFHVLVLQMSFYIHLTNKYKENRCQCNTDTEFLAQFL